MKGISLYITFFILVLTGKGQMINITGKIVTEKTSPVSAASVILLRDTVVAAETISLEDGSFTLKVTGSGDYKLLVRHSSFGEMIKVLQVKGSLDAGTIALSTNANQLSGVTVSTRKPFITKKIDRIVMDVQNNALAAGKSSMDLFQLAPGVFVNDGDISINGNPGTRVMVNGKRLQITGNDLKTYLNSLRADEIQSIEIIAHPPAEFDAEGGGGYINIVLKKRLVAGLSGSVNAGYTQGRYAGGNQGVQLDFRQKNLGLFATYSHDKTKNFEDSRFSRYIGDTISYQSVAHRINDITSDRVHAGGTYDISSRQYIAVDYTGDFTSGLAGYNSSITVQYPSGVGNQAVSGSYPRKNTKKYNNAGFNYYNTLDSAGSTFILLSDYTINKSEVFSSAKSEYYHWGENEAYADTSYRNTTPSEAKIFTADAKYTKVIKPAASISFGAKITTTDIHNIASYESYYDKKWEGVSELDYVYNYKERIIAGYASYSGKVAKTQVQLGLRGEHASTEGNLVTSHSVTSRNYFNVFPTIFLKKAVNKAGSNFLNFYYGRRISRPSYSDLNPYESYVDNYTIGRGNPYLNPSFTNSFELGYTFKNKYSITASYDRQDNMIAQYAYQLPADSLVTIYTKENFGKRTNAAIVLYTPFTIKKWWVWNNNITVRNEKVTLQDISIQKTIFSIQANQVFTVTKLLSFNVNAFYYSSIIAGNTLTDPVYMVSAGVQRRFLKGKLIAKAAMNDIFDTYRLNAKIYYSKSNVGTIQQKRQMQTFNLSAAYNFDLGKAFKKKKIESSSADEQRRL